MVCQTLQIVAPQLFYNNVGFSLPAQQFLFSPRTATGRSCFRRSLVSCCAHNARLRQGCPSSLLSVSSSHCVARRSLIEGCVRTLALKTSCGCTPGDVECTAGCVTQGKLWVCDPRQGACDPRQWMCGNGCVTQGNGCVAMGV